MLIVGHCLTRVYAKITMPGGKTLLVFFLAALVQGSMGEKISKIEDMGEPFTSLLHSMGFGPSLSQALRSQCECGACDGAGPPGWLALVLRYGFASCGGALITDRHVLTSAHCVQGLEAPQVAVLLGAVGPRSQPLRDKPEAQAGEQLRLALRIARKYKIAVITLDAPVTFSETLAPICLPAPASKALKKERAELNGMALADPGTLTLSALDQPGKVVRVDDRDIFFSSDDGVCLAFGGWPLVRRNGTNSECELIGIQTEVTRTKSTTAESTPVRTPKESSDESSDESTVDSSDESPQDSSEETATPSPTLSTAATSGPECDDPSEFVSVARYVSWIRKETHDATQCAPPNAAPPNAASPESNQRKRWRGNLRSAARAAKRRASDQAKLKAAKKAAEKRASKKTREKRDIMNNPKIDLAKERVRDARILGEQRAYEKLLSFDVDGPRQKAEIVAAEKAALAEKRIASRRSKVL